jgi:hypothetical protein
MPPCTTRKTLKRDELETIRDWNQLPLDIKKALLNVKNFKKNLGYLIY